MCNHDSVVLAMPKKPAQIPPFCSIPQVQNLLKNLAIRPLEFLALDLDRFVPSPHIVDKVTVFLGGGIELGELVALVVGRDVEGRLSFLTSNHESAADDGVVGVTEDGSSAEYVFAGGFKAGEEAT